MLKINKPVQVRTSNYNPKSANLKKRLRLARPFPDYKNELQKLISANLYLPKMKKLPDKAVTDAINLPARLSQVAAKQASANIRSLHEKVKLARKAGNKQRYQQEILDKWDTQSINVDLKKINIELDSRFIDIQKSKTSKFNYWIEIKTFGHNKRYYIPLKLTRHMKQLIYRGYQLKTNCLRINEDGTINLHFEKPKQIKDAGHIIGADIGRNKVIMCSDTAQETTHNTSIKVKEILKVIRRRQVGSNGSRRARAFLINQINYSLKHDIDWQSVKDLIIEDLSDIKNGNRWGKTHHHWRVGYIGDKLRQLSEENDVRLTRVNAAYTSQMCVICDFKDKNNRNGESFCCMKCGIEMDADLVGAINIYTRGVHSLSVRKLI